MSRQPSCAEYAISTTAVGCGCVPFVAAYMVLPGTIALPLGELGVDALGVFAKNNKSELFKPGFDPTETKLQSIESNKHWDFGRASLAVGFIALAEILPSVAPNVFPDLVEFSAKLPEWTIPTAAISSLVYGLSYLNMKRLEKNQKTKIQAKNST